PAIAVPYEPDAPAAADCGDTSRVRGNLRSSHAVPCFPIMLRASTPVANGIRSSPFGTFNSHNAAPRAIRMRLTTMWPASRSQNCADISLRRGGRGGRHARTFCGGLEIRGDVLQIRDLLRIELHIDPVRGNCIARIRDRHADLAQDGKRRALD